MVEVGVNGAYATVAVSYVCPGAALSIETTASACAPLRMVPFSMVPFSMLPFSMLPFSMVPFRRLGDNSAVDKGAPYQNVYFNPSCNWRMGMPLAKVLMVPKP